MTNSAPARMGLTALIIGPHYPPSNEVGSRRVAAFAHSLAVAGFGVVVISAKNPVGGSVESAVDDEVTVHKIPLPRRFILLFLVAVKRFVTSLHSKYRPRNIDSSKSTESIVGITPPGKKLADIVVPWFEAVDRYKKWSWSAYQYAIRLHKAGEINIVIASGPPFSSAIAATLIGRRLRIPAIIDFRDPVASRTDAVSYGEKFNRRVCERVQKFLLARAEQVIVASPGIAELFSNYGSGLRERITIVRNGFDGSPQARRQSSGHRLDIVFAGALYLNRNPEIIVAALNALMTSEDVRPDNVSVKFIGADPSPEWSKFAALVDASACRIIVQILPIIGATELAPYLERATVVLNLAQGQPIQIPAKTFEQLGLGCEILAVCERSSDTGQLLNSVAGAHVVEPGDLPAMIKVLRDLYLRHVVDGVISPPSLEIVRQFSRSAQNAIFVTAVRRALTLQRD